MSGGGRPGKRATVVSDTLFITVGDLLNRVKGIVFVPLITASVGVAEYGVFVLLLATIALAKPLSSLGIGAGFQRFASSLEESDRGALGRHFYSVLLATLALSLTGTGAVLLLAPFLSELFFDGRYQGAIELSSLAVLSGAVYSNFSKFLLARKRFRLYTVLTLLYELLPYLAFVVGLLLAGSLVDALLFYVVVDLVVALVVVTWTARGLPYHHPSPALIKQYLRYSSPLAASEVEGGLISRFDRYVIAYFLDLTMVAVYSVVVSLFRLFDGLSAPIRKQAMSYLPKVWDRGFQEESVTLLREVLLLYVAVVVGLIVCVSLHIYPLLEVFLHVQPVVPHLYLAVVLLGLASLLSNVRRFYNQLIKLHGQSAYVLWYQLLGLVPNIALNLLLIPELGVLGAAVASFASYATMVLFMERRFSLSYDRRFAFRTAGLVAITSSMWLVNALLQPDTLGALVFSMTGAIVLYSLLSYALLPSLFRSLRSSLGDVAARL